MTYKLVFIVFTTFLVQPAHFLNFHPLVFIYSGREAE